MRLNLFKRAVPESDDWKWADQTDQQIRLGELLRKAEIKLEFERTNGLISKEDFYHLRRMLRKVYFDAAWEEPKLNVTWGMRVTKYKSGNPRIYRSNYSQAYKDSIAQERLT